MEITDKLIAAIHEAMEQCGGSGTEAAKLIGLEPERLFNFIHNNKELKARWSTSKKAVLPPTEAEAISRAIVKVDENRGLAEAMEREDRMVRAGLESLGLDADSVKMAMSLQQFQRKHFTRSIEIIGGGITKSFLNVMTAVDKIEQELDNLDTGTPEGVAREAVLRQDRQALLEIMGKTYDRAHKAAMTQAIIKHKLEGDSKGGPKRKPGFGTMIKAKNVQVNQVVKPDGSE